MDNAVLDEDRVVVVGDLGGLAAAALVDRNIDEDSARTHLFQIFLLENLRSGLARDQDAADDEIGILYALFNIRIGGDEGLDTCSKQVIQKGKSLQVDIEDRDVCTHADCNLAGIGTDIAAAEDNDVCLRSSGDTGQKDALAAESLLQVLGTFLDAQTACDLAHRRQKRNAAVTLDQGLIVYTLDLARQQGIGLRFVRCQVQVGVKDQALMEQRILFLQRLLDLDHHLAAVPYLLRRVTHHSASRDILVIREAGADAGALLNQNFMSGRYVCLDIVRCHANTEFIVFDLCYTPNFHAPTSCTYAF